MHFNVAALSYPNTYLSEKYYMQSGKARRIPWDYQTYHPIRKALGYSHPAHYQHDEDYAIKTPTAAIAAIPVGPPLTKVSRLHIPIYEVNTYKGTYRDHAD